MLRFSESNQGARPVLRPPGPAGPRSKSIVNLYSILLIGNYNPNREKFCDTCRTAVGGTPPSPRSRIGHTTHFDGIDSTRRSRPQYQHSENGSSTTRHSFSKPDGHGDASRVRRSLSISMLMTDACFKAISAATTFSAAICLSFCISDRMPSSMRRVEKRPSTKSDSVNGICSASFGDSRGSRGANHDRGVLGGEHFGILQI